MGDGRFWWAGQHGTLPIAVIDSDASARQPDPFPAAEPATAVRRDWGKVATVVIAAFGLIASSASCVAAWEAWRTAHSSEELARQGFILAGPVISADPSLDGADDCRNADHPYTVWTMIRNTGRAAGEAELVVEVQEQPGAPASELSSTGAFSLAATSSQLEKLRVGCSDALNNRAEVFTLRTYVAGIETASVVLQRDQLRFLCEGSDDIVQPCGTPGTGPKH